MPRADSIVFNHAEAASGEINEQRCGPKRIDGGSFSPVLLLIGKIVKYVATVIACLVVVVLSSGLLYRKYLQHTVAEERAIRSTHGIESIEAVRIGGIDQWIEVRGRDVKNPILLYIHGGPGIAFIPLSGSFQGAWESRFTVVQWDQRGAGKTYASNNREIQRSTMKIPQMRQDTVDVVNYLRWRFKRQRIFVVGHSWGSALGLWLAHEHPDLIYAYVGVGQFVNTEENDAQAYKDALQQARSLHNVDAIKELESIAPYPAPLDTAKVAIARRWEEQLLGPPASPEDFTNPRRLLTDLVSAPQYSLRDDFGFVRGLSLSFDTFLPQLAKMDLSQLGPYFRVPIFFFEGRHDPYCRPSLVQKYGEQIKTPHEELIWFEDSGHFPFFEQKQKFADELNARVLPLAGSASSFN